MKLSGLYVLSIAAAASIAVSPFVSAAQGASPRVLTISTGLGSTTNDRFRPEVQPLLELTAGWRSKPRQNLRALLGGFVAVQSPVAGGDDCPIDSSGGCKVRLPSTVQFGLQLGAEFSNQHAGLSLASGPAVVSVAAHDRVTGRITSGGVSEIERYDGEKTLGILTRAELFTNLSAHTGLVLAAHHRYLKSVGDISVASKGMSLGLRVNW